MFIADGELVFSASDLTGFLECELLPSLNREVAAGERAAPLAVANESLAATYGDRYEQSYLATLKSSGMQVVELARPPDLSLEALRFAHDETVAALASGAQVVYQATLFVDGWLGHPDFLVRRYDRAGLWPHSYDVYDTKLARHAKASALLQVALYADQLKTVQGCQSERLVLALGNGSEVSFSPGGVASYLGMLKQRFAAGLSAKKPYPYPVAHCAICRWSEVCDGVRRGDDHLSLVAGIRREHVRKLEESEVARDRMRLPHREEIPGCRGRFAPAGAHGADTPGPSRCSLRRAHRRVAAKRAAPQGSLCAAAHKPPCGAPALDSRSL